MIDSIKVTENALYRRNESLQVFGILSGTQITLELHHYDLEGGKRIYEKLFFQIPHGQSNISSKDVFQVLSDSCELKIEAGQGRNIKLIVEKVPQNLSFKNISMFSILMSLKKKGPSVSNLTLLTISDQKIRKSGNNMLFDQTLDQSFDYQPDPIVHQSSKHKFTANYLPQQQIIKTSLWIEDAKNGKPKVYKNNIDHVYFAKQLRQSFLHLQNLFQHFRDPNNIEINFQRGRISINNQPQTPEEREFLSKNVMKRKKQSALNRTRNRISKRISMDTDMSTSILQIDLSKKIEEDMSEIKEKIQRNFNKKISVHEIKIFQKMRNELAVIEEEMSDKLFEISKGISVNKINESKSQKKVDVEILEEWKESLGKDIISKMAQQDKKVKNQLVSVVSEAKRQLALIIHKMRSQFDEMIKQNQDKCMASIDDLETDLCKKIQIMTQGQFNEKQQIDWVPIDPDASSCQFRKFIIESDNVIVNNGGFQWIQLFTKTMIPHNQVLFLKFRIISSAYNAIAIGVSDIKNISQITSLSLKNSIAYWGDRELWEGKKIREEGVGFHAGDIVIMKVDTMRGIITWSVGSNLRAEHSSLILKDNSLRLMAYVEMYDKGDKIQLLSSRIN